MKLCIDTDSSELTVENMGETRTLSMFSDEAFNLVSEQWVRMGWNQKYTYTFSWMGRPIIQLPDDMIRIQEAIYEIKPDVIIETGVAHGGSLIFYASLCKAMGKGRIVGIDIEIRPHNRKSIEAHELFPYITLIEGSSVDSDIVKAVHDQVNPGETVLILLDSNHLKDHVFKELEAYSDLVTEGSWIVATDGLMRDLTDVPRGEKSWSWDNPCEAVKDFLKEHAEFVNEAPRWPFNESTLSKPITHWPEAWLRRK
jgi:cephalosporin hydroxylase